MSSNHTVTISLRLYIDNPDDKKIYTYIKQGKKKESLSASAFIKKKLLRLMEIQEVEREQETSLKRIEYLLRINQNELLEKIKKLIKEQKLQVISDTNGTDIGRLSSDTKNELPEESSSLPDALLQVLSIFE